MPKKEKLSDKELIDAHIAKLESHVAETVQYLRQIILGTDKMIAEQIKWNSPSFYYSGDMKPFDPKEYKRDILVINLHRGKILLVLPTGEKVKDVSGILEGKYTDGRRVIAIKDLNDAKAKEQELKVVLKAWLKQVDK